MTDTDSEMRHDGAQATADEQVAEIQATFDLRWAADMRAIKRWQAATGRTLTWPDHSDLCVWLLQELDIAEEYRQKIEEALAGLEKATRKYGITKSLSDLSHLLTKALPEARKYLSKVERIAS